MCEDHKMENMLMLCPNLYKYQWINTQTFAFKQIVSLSV